MADHIEPRRFLVLGVHHVPRRLFRIRYSKHLILRAAIFGPVLARFQVHRAQLPALGGIFHAVLKPPFLFFVAHAEPILDENDPGANQHALKLRAALHEFQVLALAAEAHYILHAGAVVPAAIEQNHLSRCGQMSHVALKIPLRLLALRRRCQRHDAAHARIERLGDALDGAALARGIASFKQRHHAQAFVANPLLQLYQLDLQPPELTLVFAVLAQPLGITRAFLLIEPMLCQRFSPFAVFAAFLPLARHNLSPDVLRSWVPDWFPGICAYLSIYLSIGRMRGAVYFCASKRFIGCDNPRPGAAISCDQGQL
ncbi:hypothetical protein SBA5_400056 [Candidatus Sulfotelmatomonas gaucii]|uniref:Uncharacterized protein n=1 Tax=Candidatus Sulfuritelmatomonas gaucii TaxID=2043161 RepID=A0A2N9LKS0_9BACT|nr:hypothetical protein SBA5_400056 [Candidatus Sulfotelmatomonas gaucii]